MPELELSQDKIDKFLKQRERLLRISLLPEHAEFQTAEERKVVYLMIHTILETNLIMNLLQNISDGEIKHYAKHMHTFVEKVNKALNK